MRTPLFASLTQKGQHKVMKLVNCCLIAWVLVLSNHTAQARDQASITLEGATISLQAAPAMATSLLAETLTLADDERLIFLFIDLNEGWKTYWRLPGRFGFAPVFDWQGSHNLADARIVFPEPELFDEADGQSIGYAAPTLLPVVLRAAIPEIPVDIQLELEIGLCADLCVPERATLSGSSAELASGPGPSMAQLFDLASDLPGESDSLTPTMLSKVDNVLRTEAMENVQEGTFAIAEDARHHALLLPVEGQTSLSGFWPHDALPTRLTLVFERGQMQIRDAAPQE